jgi:hypothetical protein
MKVILKMIEGMAGELLPGQTGDNMKVNGQKDSRWE